MTWYRTDDGEFLSAWVFEVGNEAYGAYQRLGGYAAQQLTDGVVPGEIAAMIAGPSRKVLPALEIVGRIRRDENGTVRLPHFLDLNPSRAQVEADRDSARRRQETARRRAKSNGVTHP
jgi:hypothetical protein